MIQQLMREKAMAAAAASKRPQRSEMITSGGNAVASSSIRSSNGSASGGTTRIRQADVIRTVVSATINANSGEERKKSSGAMATTG